MFPSLERAKHVGEYSQDSENCSERAIKRGNISAFNRPGPLAPSPLAIFLRDIVDEKLWRFHQKPQIPPSYIVFIEA